MDPLTTGDPVIRELDHRTSDGVQVTLLWSARTNRVFVSVVDVRSGEFFHFEVAPEDALDAFQHPYAYADRPRWVTMPRLPDCPQCGLPAEIVDRFVVEGSPRPVEHVKLVCVARHWFTLPVDWMTPTHVAGTREHSRTRRIAGRIKEVWGELEYAQRRMFEIQTGVSATRR